MELQILKLELHVDNLNDAMYRVIRKGMIAFNVMLDIYGKAGFFISVRKSILDGLQIAFR